MFIEKLCEYSDVLKSKGLLPPDNYVYRGITALIELNLDGTVSKISNFKEIVTIKLKNGKEKEVQRPVQLLYPAQPDANNSFSFLIEHRPENIFGMTLKNGVYTTQKCEKKHRLFLDKNLPFFKSVVDPSSIVIAFINFMQNWNAEEKTQNQACLQELFSEFKDFTIEKFSFCLTDHPETLLQNDAGVKDSWNQICANSSPEGTAEAYCPVFKAVLPVARLHKKIMRFPGGLASGMTLVSYNNDSENSYCKEQSVNSNISQLAVDKYGAALNYLLSSDEHCVVEKTTGLVFLFWAENPDSSLEKLCSAVLFGTDNDMSESADKLLKRIIEQLCNGLDVSADTILDKEKFCIAVLSPNSARICIKAFYEGTLGSIALNIARFQSGFGLDGDFRRVGIWQLISVLDNPNVKRNDADSLYGFFRSITIGSPLPRKILSRALNRIQHDFNAGYITNNIRAGIVRACFNDIHRSTKRKDELLMSLDYSNSNPAYLCGRLFACYEAVQRNANNGKKLNRSIKDTSFVAFMRNPSKKFASLNVLFSYHIKKAPRAKFYYGFVNEIMDALGDNIPEHMNESDQARFVVGYHHQNAELYRSEKKLVNQEGVVDCE